MPGTQDLNRAVARRLADEIFGRGDLKAFDEVIAENYVNHSMPVPDLSGTKDGYRQLVLATRHAFPDVRVEVKDVVAEGDLVVFHDCVTATSKGDFLGAAPNGKTLEWTEMHFMRVAGGQIVEHWTNFDQFGILTQLGAIPAA